MDWRDTGILLSYKRHGEAAAIIEVFTEHHGRHAGVVQGGASRRFAPILQPGAQLSLAWRARLEDHIGTFSAEPIRSRAAGLMADALCLAAFGSVSSLLVQALPEREAHPQLYFATLTLADAMAEGGDWIATYVAWEVLLLQELGYGLDLNQCAVTGARENLTYVSPRSGRAVAQGAGGEWTDQLLPLPAILRGGEFTNVADALSALGTTGYFLEHRVFPALGRDALPEARNRLLARLGRHLK